MGKGFVSALLALVALTVFAAPQLLAQRKEVRKVEDAIEVFQAITNISEKQVPEYMMRNAYGVAIIPGVKKAGLVIGGQYGKGILVAANEDRTWGYPVFITLTGGSIGWQIGFQSLDLVLFFHTKRSVDKVLQKGFTLGVDVAVAAGALGRQAGAGTDADMKAEIYSYSRSKGLFAGISLAGADLEIDDEANAAYYGKADISAPDILRGTGLALPSSAVELGQVLGEYALSVSK
jgi:lipid-binding SYLF domain-containing protein